MLLVQSSLNMDIPWHIIVRHTQSQCTNIPHMIRECIPLYKPIENGSITFWGSRKSSTLIKASIVHTNLGKITKWMPSKLVHISTIVPPQH